MFDGDGVLFSDYAERITRSEGLQNFLLHERDRMNISLPKGPMKAFDLKLQKLRETLGDNNQWRIRTYLVTTRNGLTNVRVFHTLQEWGIDIDETHFLDGLDKTPFLYAINPAIFFDDSSENIDRIKFHIPGAHVPYGPLNNENTSYISQPALQAPVEKLSEQFDNLD